MTLKPEGVLRLLLALLCLQMASACGDEPSSPNPPSEDSTAPTTRATPPGGSFAAPVSVALTCEDEGGRGCEASYYTTDGSTPTKSSTRYSAPILVAATATLKFFSVDGAGNTEAVKTAGYTFDPADTTAPTVSASPAGGTYNTTQTVTLTCSDGAGTGCQSIRYTTDGSTPTAASTGYTAPITVSASTTLKFFATDGGGNASAVVTATYVIDPPPSAPTVVASPAGGAFKAAQTVTLTCTDDTGKGCASIHYTTDGNTPTATDKYTAPLSIKATTTLKFLGVDTAGNVSDVRTETYVIDPDAPTVSADPRGGIYGSVKTVTLTCTDGSGSGCAAIHYTTDGSTPDTGAPRYTAALTISKPTTLRFIAVDNAGNVSAVQTEDFLINTTPPTTTAEPKGGTYATAQTVLLSCRADDSVGECADTYYTVDGSTPDTSSPQFTTSLTISATTTLKFFSTDSYGNHEPVRTETYVISGAP